VPGVESRDPVERPSVEVSLLSTFYFFLEIGNKTGGKRAE
jgi:hypothetical protein